MKQGLGFQVHALIFCISYFKWFLMCHYIVHYTMSFFMAGVGASVDTCKGQK